jgi:putative oxidoreductase
MGNGSCRVEKGDVPGRHRGVSIDWLPCISYGVNIITKASRAGWWLKGAVMEIAVIVAQVLLGLIFVFFGLNGFLQFLKAPLPTGLAGQFLIALFQSHYVWFVCAVQIVGGVLLLVNRYVPLALTLLGPVIVNIIFYHLVLSSAGAQLAVVVTILWFFLFYRYRQSFLGLFAQKA